MQQLLLNVFRRWWWLVLLMTFVSLLASNYASADETPTYEAQARLIIGPGVESASPDLSALRTGTELMGTYAELAVTTPVLQAVIDEEGLNMTPKRLRSRITVRTSTGTRILTIRAEDPDPKRVVTIANAVAKKLVELSPSGDASPEAQLKAKMQIQAEWLEKNILATEERISQLEETLENTRRETDRILTTEQILQERSRLTNSQKTLADLYAALQRADTNQVKMVEPALNPALVDSQQRVKTLTGGLAGLILALIIAFSFEHFHHRIENAQDLIQAAGVPLLGEIPAHPLPQASGLGNLIIHAEPKSPAAESYRLLGTKLLFAKDGGPLSSVLVVSSNLNHDPGRIAANLALALAQADRRVILIDANLRQPSIGQIFGIDNHSGLTNSFSDHPEENNPIVIDRVPNLSVLPSGLHSSNPFADVASQQMAKLVQDLQSQADIVVIAAPPLMQFAESLILASHVEGMIFLVRKSETTHKEIREVIENLQAMHARIIGTILDKNGRGRPDLMITRPKYGMLQAAIQDRSKAREARSSTSGAGQD